MKGVTMCGVWHTCTSYHMIHVRNNIQEGQHYKLHNCRYDLVCLHFKMLQHPSFVLLNYDRDNISITLNINISAYSHIIITSPLV